MNKDAILTFVKKNMLSLICGLVAIIAIALIFYPLGGMITDLQTEADTQGGMYQSLISLLKPRKLPMSDPNQVDPGNLSGFPNPATVKEGQAAVDRFKALSDQMGVDLAKMNHKDHNPLVAGVLPIPSELTPFTFAAVYRQVLNTDRSVHGAPDPGNPAPIDSDLASANALNLQNDILHGALPPSDAEIADRKNQIWNDDFVPQIITQNGKEMNKQDLDTRFSAVAMKLRQTMRNAIAKKYKIYVEKTAFTVNPILILPKEKPPIDTIWFAQMQLWMQQDLCLAIAEANQDAPDVLHAEVKRLISIQLPTAPTSAAAAASFYVCPPPVAGATGGGTGNLPSTLDDKVAIPPVYTVSVTGRYSNGMYDVVHFTLAVDVDAARVNQFIQTLSNNRLITVTNESQYALNADLEAASGYFYGPGSSVRLQVEGEELFMRKWTSDLMPKEIKAALAGTPGAAGPSPSPGGGPGMMMPPGAPGGPGYGRPPGQQ